ncbi:glucosamine-6-phosphate deaminase [Proteinivorax hydrogeniformans]|uniref:Glucosamine-6-phosphate deaminase n=1 Tax=Proteinivorax hydrogeniformans TaxID=1826727 RepID=A0AAU8HR09_9FIRM
MKILICENYEHLSEVASNIIEDKITANPKCVLGLATGGTPEGTYQRLIDKYKQGSLDFSSVTTFNLDEYYGLNGRHPQSYAKYMYDKLFKHINIDINNTNIPQGDVDDIKKECKRYEEAILEAGGIDLQLLGIGTNGHIGFNEPNAYLKTKTHLVKLKEETINANSRFFEKKEDVPTRAITMGIKSIFRAKEILLLASGPEKAPIIMELLKGQLSTYVPASILNLHPSVTIVVDKAFIEYLKKQNVELSAI